MDEIATDRAEKWLAAHEDDLAAVETRCQAAHDRRDAAFVRFVEKRFGLIDFAIRAWLASKGVMPKPARKRAVTRKHA